MYYKLENREVKPVNSVLEWAEFMEKNNTTIAMTRIGEITISTVFLGLDHNFHGGKPLLFETMVFGGDHDAFQVRYSTIEEAELGHEETSKLIKIALK